MPDNAFDGDEELSLDSDEDEDDDEDDHSDDYVEADPEEENKYGPDTEDESDTE